MKTEVTGATAVLAAFWGLLCSYCVKLMIPLIILLVVVLLDYFTGMAKATVRNEWCSKVGFLGIIKKVSYAVIIVVAGVTDWLITYGLQQVGIDLHLPFLLALIVTCWLIINELISILENVAEMGGPVPPWLGRLLNKLKSTVDDKVEPKGSEDKPGEEEADAQ